MKVIVLHTKDALGPPADPVIEQLLGAFRAAAGHEADTLAVDATVEPVVSALQAAKPDLVFNIAESYGGKSALESNVAALLNLLDLRYTGSSPAGLILAGDKTLTKMVLRFHAIKTPVFATLFRGTLEAADELAFPLIIKPPQEDASIGVTQKSIVRTPTELLQRAGALQTQFPAPVLIEQYVEGREFYVGVLGNAEPKALPVVEMDFSKFPAGKTRIASYEAKWGEGGEGTGDEFAGTESIFPENVPDELVGRMQQVAIAAFKALRLRDYARIDLRVTKEGEIFVIEVNPNCYLEAKSEFARAAERDGLPYPALIERIAELASARYAR